MDPKKTTASFLYASMLIILLAIGLMFFIRSSYFTIKQVQIEGLQQISEPEIQRLVAEVIGQNLLLFEKERIQQKISLHPLVESTEFIRRYPDTLVFKIKEREPVAFVVVARGVVEVDAKGMYLRRDEGWPKKSYPIINGITIPETSGPGQELKVAGLQTALFLLGQAPKELLPLIGEIFVSPIEQITIFLNNGVEVRLGKSNTWTIKLQALIELLNDSGFKSFQEGVKYIDFTAAKPVIGR